jgi:phosphoglycolate phosphatase-like HAD superfamily hydrolase
VRPAVLLWDFGDTLVDEGWMRRPPEHFPGWESVWVEVMAELAGGWDDGSVTDAEVFDAMAARTGLTVAAVESHARACCTGIDFHPHAWRVARERRLPQALVTVNPTMLDRWIVPHYGLASMFDAVVVSALEGTTDKPELCHRALARLGYDGPRSQALLIDNRRDVVEAWTAAGGAGYWFRGDDQFARDVDELLDQS